MARLAPVPKFGDWDSQEQSFTLLFDNVRAEKGVGGRVITPNDPEFYSSPLRDDKQRHVQDPEDGSKNNFQICFSDHKVQRTPSPPAAVKMVSRRKARAQRRDEYNDSSPASVHPELVAKEDEARAEVFPQKIHHKSGQEIDYAAFVYSVADDFDRNGVKTPGRGTQLEWYAHRLDPENGSNAYESADIKRFLQSPLHHQEYRAGKLGSKATVASSPRKVSPLETGPAAGKLRGTARVDEMPAQLPKLDGRRPCAADSSYTAVFNQLRNEKRASHRAHSLHSQHQTPGRRNSMRHAASPLRSTPKWTLCCSAPLVKQ